MGLVVEKQANRQAGSLDVPLIFGITTPCHARNVQGHILTYLHALYMIGIRPIDAKHQFGIRRDMRLISRSNIYPHTGISNPRA